MCGIAAIVGPHAQGRRPQLDRMLDALAHRGPDGRGVLERRGCLLGHTRLSIVDLAHGDQPMSCPLGPRHVVLNGEIYGYQELRRGESDYPFRTLSDTELLLALYARVGGRLPEHLPGMFAFALWDEREQVLLAARDRFGEKPLYFAPATSGELLIASEIKALLASGMLSPRLDRASLAHYLQYLYVPPSRTIYENVHVLPPGHALQWRDGAVRVRRYWSPPAPRRAVSIVDAATELRTRLSQAVRRCLVADVPVAAFLSGGLDSTSVVACAVESVPHLRTLAFGFRDELDERPFARAAAELYGTDHAELIEADLDPGTLLREMQRIYDEPFGDSSCIPTYALCRAARRHTKVVLSGDGGDELFAGYAHWYRPLLARRSESAESVLRAHRRQRQYFRDDELRALGLAPPPPTGAAARGDDPLEAVLYDDLTDYLPGDILVKTDRAAMACGLELRCPLLDVEFASFCLSLPASLKIDAAVDKRVLREAFAAGWPDAVRRRAKQGFGAPVERWLRMPSMQAHRDEFLGDSRRRIFELLPAEPIAALARRGDARTWLLLVLSMWLESHPCDAREAFNSELEVCA